MRRHQSERGARVPLRRRLEKPGLSARIRRAFDRSLVLLLALFALGWSWTIRDAVLTGASPGMDRVLASPLSPSAAPETAYLLDAALQRFVARDVYAGLSGQVRVVVQEPGGDVELPSDLPEGVHITYRELGDTAALPATATPTRPGVWNVLVGARGALREVPNLLVLRMLPIEARQQGSVGRYRIGEWPFEDGAAPRGPEYTPPRGLVEVTPENQDLRVSRHFRLRDFLTKGQDNVWPKYVLISPRLLDKLELTIDELNATGTPVNRVGIISGFRTPFYNSGGGDPRGRGSLSRHMYGDAMDFFIDNGGDGRMDDLNGDGRVNTEDLRVVLRAAEAVERRHPHLLGGFGIYPATGAHGGFVHIDTRGYRARW